MSLFEAVILAGGLGTRLRPVVSDLPKPMAPVSGRPFLEYLMDFWIDGGVGRFILAVGYKHEAVIDHFGFFYRDIPIDYSIEPEPVGTGGGLFLALEKIRGKAPFFIVNGDTFFPVDASSTLTFHEEKKSKFTMVLKEMTSAERYGTVRLKENSRIERFCPLGQAEPPYLINGGVYLANPDFIKKHRQDWDGRSPVSSENFLFPKWADTEEAFFGFRESGEFIDIGIPEDYKRCQEFFNAFNINPNT